MKNRFIFFGIIIALVSCSSSRPVASNASSTSNTRNHSSPEFINDISINSGAARTGNNTASTTSLRRRNDEYTRSSSMERYSSLQFKYAILENASVEEMTNTRLLEFMDEWYGTQYHYGGTTKDGIDCSAFASILMSSVYNISGLPRSSRDQYDQCRRVARDDLREGDLVFFHTNGKHHEVSHVGIYLRNNKFVHASVSGVMISDMQTGYYAEHFIGAGRIAGDQ